MKKRALLVAFLFASPLAAQTANDGTGLRPALPPTLTTSQFRGTAPTSFSLFPDRDAQLKEAENARIRLGPLRMRPRLYVGNVGYTNNFFGETTEEQVGDVTLTAGGGLYAIVPVGSRVFLKGSIVPTYTWYLNHPERRGFGGTYDFSALFYLSRFSLRLTGGSYTTTENLSSEVQQPVKQSSLLGRADLQYELGSRTMVTTSATVQQRRYGGDGLTPEQEATVSALDGTDFLGSVGVNRRIGGGLRVGLSYEQGAFASVSEGELRDYESQGVLGSAYLDRGKLSVNIYAGYRDYRPAEGSSFPGAKGPSGGGTVGYRLGRLLTVGIQGYSGLVPSLSQENTAYQEIRGGPTVGFSLRKAQLSLSYLVGRNDYVGEQTLPGGDVIHRQDDTQTVRGYLSLPLVRWLKVGANATWNDYQSNVPGQDRSVFQVGFDLGIGTGYRGIEIIGDGR